MININEDLEKEICDYYLNQPTPKNLPNISKRFNLNSNYIKIILKHNNIDFKFYNSRKPSNNVDINFFKEINTEQQAYWLGFFLADGYLNNLGHIGVELSIEDYEHLIKFKKDLDIKNDVYRYNKNSTFGKQTNCRISFVNYYVLYDLWYKWGIDLNKSNTGKIPKINDSLYKHLIRGYFDGNGSLTIRKNKLTNEIVCKNLGICGTKEILLFIEDISNFKWNWSKRRNNDTNNFQIEVGRRYDCYNFLEWLYGDSTIYLDRKYNKYKQITK